MHGVMVSLEPANCSSHRCSGAQRQSPRAKCQADVESAQHTSVSTSDLLGSCGLNPAIGFRQPGRGLAAEGRD